MHLLFSLCKVLKSVKMMQLCHMYISEFSCIYYIEWRSRISYISYKSAQHKWRHQRKQSTLMAPSYQIMANPDDFRENFCSFCLWPAPSSPPEPHTYSMTRVHLRYIEQQSCLSFKKKKNKKKKPQLSSRTSAVDEPNDTRQI